VTSPCFSFIFKQKMKQTLKQDKGTAGLTILLSVVVMLFMIGLLVMIFTLMGGELRDASYTSTTGTELLDTVTVADYIGTGGYTLRPTYTNGAGSYAIVALYNNTNELLLSGNYTLTGDVLTNATVQLGLIDMKVNFTYVYDAENVATTVMNDTSTGIASVADWFDIFIVIASMVVLILLTVIIITAIRSSGMVEGGSYSGAGNSYSA